MVDAVRQLVQPKTLPIQSPTGQPEPLRSEKELSNLESIRTQLGLKRPEQAEFQATQAQFGAEQEKAKAAGRAKATEAERQAIETAPAYTEAQEVERDVMNARFEPTQRSAQENMALMAAMNILGYFIGAGGKNSAQQAMSAFNGMLEGKNAGDIERFKQEKIKFDTNLKALKDRYSVLTSQLKRVADLAARDKEKAMQELDVVLAENQADFIKEHINKFGIAATIKNLEDAEKGAVRLYEKALGEEERARRDAESKAFARQERLAREAFTRQERQAREEAAKELEAQRQVGREAISSLRQVGGGRSATNERYAGTVIRSSNEVLRSLELIERIGLEVGTGALGQVVGKGTIPSEVQRQFSQYLTSEQERNYNAAMSGLGLELAFVLGGGYKPDVSLQNKIETYLAVGPNDTVGNAAFKFADVVSKLKAALEVQTSYNEDQKKSKESLMSKLDKYATPEEIYSKFYGAAPATPSVDVRSTAPPRPEGVPSNARYSPSQKSWWWQEGGEWKSKGAQ